MAPEPSRLRRDERAPPPASSTGFTEGSGAEPLGLVHLRTAISAKEILCARHKIELAIGVVARSMCTFMSIYYMRFTMYNMIYRYI